MKEIFLNNGIVTNFVDFFNDNNYIFLELEDSDLELENHLDNLYQLIWKKIIDMKLEDKYSKFKNGLISLESSDYAFCYISFGGLSSIDLRYKDDVVCLTEIMKEQNLNDVEAINAFFKEIEKYIGDILDELTSIIEECTKKYNIDNNCLLPF